jgi:hypothetical protein
MPPCGVFMGCGCAWLLIFFFWGPFAAAMGNSFPLQPSPGVVLTPLFLSCPRLLGPLSLLSHGGVDDSPSFFGKPGDGYLKSSKPPAPSSGEAQGKAASIGPMPLLSLFNRG